MVGSSTNWSGMCARIILWKGWRRRIKSDQHVWLCKHLTQILKWGWEILKWEKNREGRDQVRPQDALSSAKDSHLPKQQLHAKLIHTHRILDLGSGHAVSRLPHLHLLTSSHYQAITIHKSLGVISLLLISTWASDLLLGIRITGERFPFHNLLTRVINIYELVLVILIITSHLHF